MSRTDDPLNDIHFENLSELARRSGYSGCTTRPSNRSTRSSRWSPRSDIAYGIEVDSLLETLRHRRHQLGLSQRDLPDRTGLPQPVIAAYESGTREPGITRDGQEMGGDGQT